MIVLRLYKYYVIARRNYFEKQNIVVNSQLNTKTFTLKLQIRLCSEYKQLIKST